MAVARACGELRGLDFRAAEDDAWYGVCLQMEGEEVLRIMYVNFPEQFDERVPLSRFHKLPEVEAFAARFRPSSVQLQDGQCRVAAAGTTVCVAHTFAESDLRFYDATVERVSPSTHILMKGDEICKCKFEILWLHGPLAGDRTIASIENICLVRPRSSNVDLVLDNFLEIARKKLETRSSQMGPLESLQTSGQQCEQEVRTCNLNDIAEHTPSTGRTFNYNELVENIDLGGKWSLKEKDYHKESYYFVRIENVENDLSPFTLMEFIQEKTSISTQAILCPGLSESYARAAICIDDKEKAEDLYDFLHNPEHIIMSLSGRPWVINEKWCGSVDGMIPRYKNQPQSRSQEHITKLKLVHKGTEEYKKGKELIELHMQYHEHVERLRKRLALVERELMQNL